MGHGPPLVIAPSWIRFYAEQNREQSASKKRFWTLGDISGTRGYRVSPSLEGDRMRLAIRRDAFDTRANPFIACTSDRALRARDRHNCFKPIGENEPGGWLYHFGSGAEG